MIAKIVSIFLTRSLAFCDFLWLDVEFVFLLRVRERKSYYRGMRENCRPPWSRRLEKLLIFSRWPRVIFHLHLRPLAGLCTRIRFMAPWPRRSPEDREFVEDASWTPANRWFMQHKLLAAGVLRVDRTCRWWLGAFADSNGGICVLELLGGTLRSWNLKF